MIFDQTKHRMFLYNEFVDMRKGHSSLSMLITQKTKFEIMEGTLFLFVSRNKKILKGIFFDGTGLVLVHKKLESGRYMSINSLKSPFELFEDDFKIVFHGGHLPISRNGKRIRFQKK